MGLIGFFTLIVALVFLARSVRSSIQSLRDSLDHLVGDGTLTSRLLPNLSFTLLFFLLLFQSMQTKMPTPLSDFLGMNVVHDLHDVRSNGSLRSLTVGKETE
jgi:hypothetical protein